MQVDVVDRNDGVVEVALVGKMDTLGADEINLEFHSRTAVQQRPTLVDLSQLEFIK